MKTTYSNAGDHSSNSTKRGNNSMNERLELLVI